MIESEGNGRDLAGLMVARVGRLVATGEHGEPYRLVDASDAVVEPAAVFLRELLAAGRSAATLRSYGMDLLRWWRFLHAVDVGWDRATRVEALIGTGQSARAESLKDEAVKEAPESWMPGVLEDQLKKLNALLANPPS